MEEVARGRAGLLAGLEALNFHLVGFGCTTCIGNSGPLPDAIATAIKDHKLIVASVLSGNRNFEGRINPHVRANYLASPPLVVAYALAGDMDIDLRTDPIGFGRDGRPAYLADLWPSPEEIRDIMASAIEPSMYERRYAAAWDGDERWRSLEVPRGDTFAWDESSTYVRKPPFFDGMPAVPTEPRDVRSARVLALLGDSVTTDHISPAGSIPADGPAGRYLIAHGVKPADFNSFGARRGNHEVMMRGTFGNIRLRNMLAPGTEGGVTLHLPDGASMSIYDAAMAYQKEGVPLIVLAGKEYGTGSSRDWAAKGAMLLGVRAVIAESFERIHRSNLAGMGILPLEFAPGETAESLGLDGHETYSIEQIAARLEPGGRIKVKAQPADGTAREFTVTLRLDTPREVAYYRHGGILPYVLRDLLSGESDGDGGGALRIEPARPADMASVRDLVTRCGLPTEGIDDRETRLIVARDADRIVGCAGVEIRGAAAVVRSLAVDPSRRGGGLGRRLMAEILGIARDAGCRDVYGLTATALRMMERLGFEAIPREKVPDDARASREFSIPACSSATAIHRSL